MSLKEGVVGKELVKWFEENEEMTPTYAECIGGNAKSNIIHYRVTFDNGAVADYSVQFFPSPLWPQVQDILPL